MRRIPGFFCSLSTHFQAFRALVSRKVFAADGSGERTPEEIPVHGPLNSFFLAMSTKDCPKKL